MFLTIPAPNDATLRSVRRKVQLLATRRLLTQPGSAIAPLQSGLLSLLERKPDDVLEAVGGVDVLSPLLMLIGAVRAPEACLADAVPPLLVALSRKGCSSLRWDAPVARVVDARGGRVFEFDPPAEALTLDGGSLVARLASGRALRLFPDTPDVPDGVRVRRPFHSLTNDHPVLNVSEIDTNPLAMLEDHPEKSGNAVDLGGRSAGEWVDAVRAALELVRAGLPTWYAELALERIVPVGYDAERHSSASYREAPGLAYLSLHPDPLTLAEVIVHETQHGKLNLLSWLDPVLRNARTCWTESPVRPDPRPLMGVLLAAHAFVPVAALHRALAEAGHPLAAGERFERRRAEVLASNEQGLRTLRELADPTPTGRRVLDALEELHAELVTAAPRGLASAPQ